MMIDTEEELDIAYIHILLRVLLLATSMTDNHTGSVVIAKLVALFDIFISFLSRYIAMVSLLGLWF